MFAVFSLGALAATISLGAVQFAAASGGSTITACANKSTGAMRLLAKGSCKKTERKIAWNQQGIQGPAGPAGAPGLGGTTVSAGAAATASKNLHVIDAAGQDLGALVSTDMNDGYSFLKDDGIWTAHPGVMDYTALVTNYYSNSNCSSPIGIVRYSSDVAFTTTLSNERYITKRGTVTSAYKPSGAPFRGRSVSSVFQWSSASSRCVLTYTDSSLADVLFVYLSPVALPTYTAPISIVLR
jgi:hypothetical protein